MQTMIKISLMLLISFLSACTTAKIDDLEQCLSKLDIQIDGEGKPYIGENYGCFCRTYRHSKDYIGPVTEFKKEPINKCDNAIGYNVLDYVKLNDFFERVRRSMVRRFAQPK
jgi:hypothetical protein